MYKCQKCRKQIEEKIPQAVVTTKTRKKVYPNSDKQGYEIKEVRKLCPSCLSKQKSKEKNKK